jgi:hypothetical protein
LRDISNADIETEEAPYFDIEAVRYADELIGKGNVDALLRHHKEQKCMLGRGMLQILCEGLLDGGYSGNPNSHHATDMSFALLGGSHPVSQLIRHVIFLVKYLEKGHGKQRVSHFLNCIKRNSVWEWNFGADEEVCLMLLETSFYLS